MPRCASQKRSTGREQNSILETRASQKNGPPLAGAYFETLWLIML